MRNLTIEYLRVALIGLIVLLHLTWHLVPSSNLENFDYWELMETNLIKGIVGLGVTGFIYISGYFGVSFKWSRFIGLWSQTTFYTIASSLLMTLIFNQAFGIRNIIDSVLSLFDGPWFTTYYFYLMLMCPIINKGIGFINKNTFTIIVGLMAFMLYGAMWFHCKPAAISLHLFIFVYLLGRYVALYPISFVEKHKFLLFVLSLSLLCIFSVLPILLGKPELSKFTLGNFVIFLPLTFIPLFALCNSIERFGNGNFITKGVLAVYLIHTSTFGREVLYNHLTTPNTYNLPYLLFLVLVTIFICSVVEKIRLFIFNPLETKVSGYLSKRLSI